MAIQTAFNCLFGYSRRKTTLTRGIAHHRQGSASVARATRPGQGTEFAAASCEVLEVVEDELWPGSNRRPRLRKARTETKGILFAYFMQMGYCRSRDLQAVRRHGNAFVHVIRKKNTIIDPKGPEPERRAICPQMNKFPMVGRSTHIFDRCAILFS